MKRHAQWILAAAVIAAVLIGQAISQQEPPPQRGDGRRGDMGQFRQRMMERLKADLKATDDEWKVLEPKITKVTELQMQSRAGMGRMFGPRRGQEQGQEAPAPATEVGKKSEELRKLLDDTSAKPDAVKAALKTFRDARDKSKAELADAQKDLRGVVNLRQESYLVLRGILD
jgi:hypothetical protein